MVGNRAVTSTNEAADKAADEASNAQAAVEEQLTDEELEQISVESMPLEELGQLMGQASSYRTDSSEHEPSEDSAPAS